MSDVDFLHMWAEVAQHCKNIHVRQVKIANLIASNKDDYYDLEMKMNALYKRYQKDINGKEQGHD